MIVFLVVLNGGLGAILGSAVFNSYLIGGATGIAIMLFFWLSHQRLTQFAVQDFKIGLAVLLCVRFDTNVFAQVKRRAGCLCNATSQIRSSSEGVRHALATSAAPARSYSTCC
jgi:hypothetical protein